MAFDRQGAGLAVTRVMIGVFFIFMSFNKFQWLTDTSLLGDQLSGWRDGVAEGSSSYWYLSHVAIPWVGVFARLVPLAEFVAGVALVLGVWTRLVALGAFLMVLNFQFASGLLFEYRFLTNGYCLPVLASTLGLAVGGSRLPWSLR